MREPTGKQNRTFVHVCGIPANSLLFIKIAIAIGIAIEIGINGVLFTFVVYPR
jgi:hypothetical protein